MGLPSNSSILDASYWAHVRGPVAAGEDARRDLRDCLIPRSADTGLYPKLAEQVTLGGHIEETIYSFSDLPWVTLQAQACSAINVDTGTTS